MALTSGIIPNLLGGVSQQPVILRHPTQLEEQRNFVTSPAEGLMKRPPVEYYAYLGNNVVGSHNAFYHTINRDPTERYLLIIENQNLKVYDLVNKEFKTVNAPNGTDYLQTGGVQPRLAIRAVTVADYTFILNRTVTAAHTSDKTGWQTKLHAYVIVKQGHYSTNYKIITDNDGVIANYTTPASTDTGAEAAIATDQIAAALKNAVNAGTAQHGITALHNHGNVVRLAFPDEQGVSVADGLGGNGLQILHHTVQSFADLPRFGFRGAKIEVIGDPGTDFDNFWVQAEGHHFSPTELTWVEVAAPEIEFALNAATMPHVLIRESDGTFTFKQAEWGSRECGDLETNPWPSFVGQKINDVFFYKNRLGFVSGENMILSEVGGYFNFFRTTATTHLDTDPIDVTVSTNEVVNLRHVAQTKGRLFAFSQDMMFELEGDPLTPKTAALTMVARIKSKVEIGPLVAGFAMYLPFDRGSDFAGINEVIPHTSEGEYLINDVTSHVPSLLVGDIASMAYSDLTQTLYVDLHADFRNRVYCYRTHWIDKAEGREKVISAWSHWEFPDLVTYVTTIDHFLYIVFFNPDNNRLTVGRVDLREGVVEGPDWDWRILLDMRVPRDHPDVTSSYDGTNTTFTMPWRWDDQDEEKELYVLDVGSTNVKRLTPDSVDGDNGTIVFNNVDLSTANLLFGLEYTAVARFSLPVVREARGESLIPVSDGELFILWWTVNYAKSLRIRALVEIKGQEKLGYTDFFLTEPPKFGGLVAGQMRFPVRASTKGQNVSIAVINDRPWPSNFINAGWEANLIRRAPRRQ